MTLIEVLISMGVLTIGILGVAALFPVGSHYALRGEIYDRADAAAASAFNDAVTRGTLDPERWVSATSSTPRASFTRPFAEDFRTRRAFWASRPAAQKQSALDQMVRECGSLYFIDPVGVASGMNLTTGAAQYESPHALRSVPASHDVTSKITMLPRPQAKWWSPWSNRAAITRITLAGEQQSSGFAAPAMPAMAELLSAVQDDLSTDTDTPADEPAQQLALQLNGVRLKRQNEGHFSYLISVAPRTYEAWHALPYGGQGHAYDVSAVVFHRRAPNRFDPGDGFGGIATTASSERICAASAVVSAPGGGEVRLYANTSLTPDAFSKNGTFATNLPWKDLKTGQYVLLFGPSPASYDQRPLLFAQWYRVVAIDDSDVASSGTTYLGPSVALRGPDWPWASSSLAATTGSYAGVPPTVQDDLRVLILDGAVAVHTRTMRLDAGAAWRE